jgi:hypothetical protein
MKNNKKKIKNLPASATTYKNPTKSLTVSFDISLQLNLLNKSSISSFVASGLNKIFSICVFAIRNALLHVTPAPADTDSSYSKQKYHTYKYLIPII